MGVSYTGTPIHVLMSLTSTLECSWPSLNPHMSLRRNRYNTGCEAKKKGSDIPLAPGPRATCASRSWRSVLFPSASKRNEGLLSSSFCAKKLQRDWRKCVNKGVCEYVREARRNMRLSEMTSHDKSDDYKYGCDMANTTWHRPCGHPQCCV